MFYRVNPKRPREVEVSEVNSDYDSDWDFLEDCGDSELAKDRVLDFLVDELQYLLRTKYLVKKSC